jgi:predicted MPP superfamily phosphohydrolase
MWYKIVLILIILILFFVAVMVIDNHRFVVRRYTLRSKRIRYPVRFVFVADLHEKSYGKENEALVDAIAALSPDAVLVGGDLIVSGRIKREAARKNGDAEPGPSDTNWMKHSLSFVKRLARISDVWFVAGNHEARLSYYEEFRPYDRVFQEEMERAGVHFLHNRRVDPFAQAHDGEDSGIRLCGLELPMRYYKKFTKTALSKEALFAMLGTADPNVYTVLLTHTPVYFEQYAEWGADLCLCGHVHGGLMRLPFIGGVMGTRPNLFPKYSGGQYSYPKGDGGGESSTLVLTCGLGMHTLPIRIFNPGEISYIELLPEQQ